MKRFMLKGKIQGARITRTRLDYEGSITVDTVVLAAAGIEPYEMVHVLNLNNGERAETYAISGRRGAGAVELNGPAARLGEVGDEVVVLAYGLFDPGEKPAPRCVRLGARNRIKSVRPARS
jgi:aspartate 1-decarboxylase